jgi:cobalt-zinc-cadmium efflux system outer membrane protein
MIRQLARVALAAALGVGATSALSAQAPVAARPLTLADVLRIVQERQPALAMASARRQLAGAQARQDAAVANPTAEWRREGLGGVAGTDAFFTVAQPVDVTGRRVALRSAARAVDTRMLADSTTVARTVEADAVRAYLRASLARALLTLATEQRSDAERLATTDSIRACEGAIAEASAMRAALEAARARLAEAGAAAEWARARADLGRALSVSEDALLDVAALTPMADAPTLEGVWTRDALLAQARATRSELTAGRAAQEAARARERAATRGVLGDVGFQAGQKRTGSQSFGVLAVALPIPLWNQNHAARDAAIAERRLADAELRAVDASVSAEVAAAVASYETLRSARPRGGTSLVARADEVARIADGAYGAGGASLVELLDARRARADALAALLRWSADLRLAELDLVRATGRPFTDLLEKP